MKLCTIDVEFYLILSTLYSNIRFFGFIKLYKKFHYCIFLLEQILVESHRELKLMCTTSKKNRCKCKNWLGLQVI